MYICIYICKNYMVFKHEFTCTATGKIYKVRGDLTCKSDNVVYLIGCKKCKQQYVGSAFESNFNPGLEFTKVISVLAKTSVEWPSIS